MILFEFFLHLRVNKLKRLKIFNIKPLSYAELLNKTWVLEDHYRDLIISNASSYHTVKMKN